MGAPDLQGDLWSLIDAAKLQAIKNLADPDEDDNFFNDLLAIFFERVPKLINEIRLAVETKEALKLEHAAHALKGTAGNLGAICLMKKAEQLETMGAAGQFLEAPMCLTELERIYPLTKIELESNWI
ncbi:MAG: Hpt domain-containing protein [Proteobacteria bacterium]|nr:Hpt domain-containing protein [Pseudomonadota bacterium]